MMDSTLTVWEITITIPSEAKLLCLAALLGLLIGLERAWRHKVASLRTFSMICAGSCLFSMMSLRATSDIESYDVSRIAAQVVSGVGFLGGGVIFKTANRVEGITTAAMIWLAAAIGMAVGFGHVKTALWAFAIWYALNVFSLTLHRIIDAIHVRSKSKVASTSRAEKDSSSG